MRASRVVTALVLVISVIPFAAPTAEAEDNVVFTGSGWGHGLGLSQWGAYERARQGQDAEEIVTTYYPTTSLVAASSAMPSWYDSNDEPVWVNMLATSPGSNRSSFTIRGSSGGLMFCQQEPRSEAIWSRSNNEAEFSIYVQVLEQRLSDDGYQTGPVDGWFDDATDTAVKTFQTDQGLTADGIVGRKTKAALWPPESGDRCVIETPLPTVTTTVAIDQDGNCPFPGAIAIGDCLGSVRDLSTANRVILPQKTDSGQPVELAHGNLRIRPDIDFNSSVLEGVHVVLEVGLEDYTAGIDEVMTWWSGVGANEALKAQAIAARTYGLRLVSSYGELGQVNGSVYPYTDTQLSAKQRDNCWCHLYSNSFSQVYNGWTRETEDGGTWPDAVAATVDQTSGDGLVLTAPDHGVIWAFYTSSNGGASESHDAHNGYAPPSKFSYLVSVPDPYSLTPDNPFASWTTEFSPAYVALKLGFQELTGIEVTATNESGSAKTVNFHGIVSGGPAIVSKSGTWVDTTFGLRSRFFDVEYGDTSTETPPPPDPGFGDIDESIFVGDIEWAVQEGIAFGCNPPENDSFCPTRPVTREEMAVFMTSALDLPPSTRDHFTDDETSPYEDEINRLAEARITMGCGGTNFCPDLEVDRGQMAAFLGRAYGLTDNGGGDLFTDDDNSIFENDIDRLGTAGITRGCNPPANTRFCPNHAVDRGAMMAFLHRAADG